MVDSELEKFFTLLTGTATLYDKNLNEAVQSLYWNALKPYPYDLVEKSFNKHLGDSEHGTFMPKPADIIRNIEINASDGRPGSEEACATMMEIAFDESAAGVYTEEMRIAWIACNPYVESGDRIAFRMTFREVYDRECKKARDNGIAPRWMFTGCNDNERCRLALQRAVERNLLTREYAATLMPSLPPTKQALRITSEVMQHCLPNPKQSDEPKKSKDEWLAELKAAVGMH